MTDTECRYVQTEKEVLALYNLGSRLWNIGEIT